MSKRKELMFDQDYMLTGITLEPILGYYVGYDVAIDAPVFNTSIGYIACTNYTEWDSDNESYCMKCDKVIIQEHLSTAGNVCCSVACANEDGWEG